MTDAATSCFHVTAGTVTGSCMEIHHGGHAILVDCGRCQFAVTYVPPFQAVLGTGPIGLGDGALIIATGAAFFAIIEIEKQIRLGLLDWKSQGRSIVKA